MTPYSCETDYQDFDQWSHIVGCCGKNVAFFFQCVKALNKLNAFVEYRNSEILPKISSVLHSSLFKKYLTFVSHCSKFSKDVN